MKKVLVISEIPVWTIRGKAGIEVLYKTIDRFSIEYDVTVIAPGKKPEGLRKPTAFYGLRNEVFAKLSPVPFIGYLYKYIYWLLFCRQVKQIVRREHIQYDFLYLVGPLACWAGSKINIPRKKIISRHFGVAWNPSTHHRFRQKVKFFLKNAGYRKGGDLMIVTDDGTRGKDFFLGLGYDEQRLRFWKNGINKTLSFDPEFKSKFARQHHIPEDVNIVMTLSRLASWKRVERTILAFPAVLKTFPNSVLLIVGEGDQKSKLIALAEELAIRSQVIFAGAVQRSDLGSYYRMTDLFVSMYDYSNAGNPLFEAMQYGKCIITLDNGDTKKFLHEGAGILLEHYSPELLSAAICDMLGNDEKRRRFGSYAKEFIGNTFQDWEERMEMEIREINTLINEKPSSV